ncbi:hypothetical protein AABB24_007690 [Solanum stoloniferum]|uniref:NPH3 domain-containing protein n=1 Tax=Solanum stoloniferum TaxID=62892 RepID=A0ABD2UQR9_9SOLN
MHCEFTPLDGYQTYQKSNSDSIGKHRLLLESITSLLPAERGTASCSFLLKLLKAANILKASSSSKMELATRFGLQLEETTVGDLLIPTFVSNTSDTIYDVDIVMTILEQFMLQGPPTSPPRVKRDFVRRRKSRSAEIIDLEFQESRRSSSASHSSKLKVLSLWMDISKRFPGRKSTCLFQNSFPLLKQFLIFQGSITMIFIEPLTSILRFIQV